MYRGSVFFALLALSAVAHASPSAPTTRVRDDGLDVSAVLLSASEANRTAEITLGTSGNAVNGAKFSKVRVEVNYSNGGAGITNLTVTPWCKRAVSGTYARYTARNCGTTVCEVNKVADTYDFEDGGAVASVVLMLEYDVRGCQAFKVVADSTGSPHASDAVSVGIVAVAGE